MHLETQPSPNAKLRGMAYIKDIKCLGLVLKFYLSLGKLLTLIYKREELSGPLKCGTIFVTHYSS